MTIEPLTAEDVQALENEILACLEIDDLPADDGDCLIFDAKD
ncbi:hypothetical protein [Thiolapillus sp.]